jgi:hypothetical protein
MIGSYENHSQYPESKLNKDLGPIPKIAKRPLLQSFSNTPFRVLAYGNTIYKKTGLFLPDRGGSLKRLHWSNLFTFGCKSFKGKPVFQDLLRFRPVCRRRGPYEAAEGIYLGQGQRKNRGWQGF